MDLQYKKVMEQNGLELSDLPEDAQIAIENINEVSRALNMLEKRGKTPTQKTLNKLKALDKWATYEIYDILKDTDKNDDEMPENPEKLVQEINEQAVDGNPEQPQEINKVGLEIESEIENLLKTGKTNFNFDELKKSAKRTYDVLFDGYEEGYDNGIETSRYNLIETDKHLFTISKK